MILQRLSRPETRCFEQALSDLRGAAIPGDGDALAEDEILEDLSFIESFIAGVVSSRSVRTSEAEVRYLLVASENIARRRPGEPFLNSLGCVLSILKSIVGIEWPLGPFGHQPRDDDG